MTYSVKVEIIKIAGWFAARKVTVTDGAKDVAIPIDGQIQAVLAVNSVGNVAYYDPVAKVIKATSGDTVSYEAIVLVQ